LGLRRAQDYLREREMVGDFNENKIKQKQMKIGFQKRKRKNYIRPKEVFPVYYFCCSDNFNRNRNNSVAKILDIIHKKKY
jgi:hypothetical protein